MLKCRRNRLFCVDGRGDELYVVNTHCVGRHCCCHLFDNRSTNDRQKRKYKRITFMVEEK